MRSSLTIGGIEVEVRTPAGPLEPILVEHCGLFLGAVVRPVCRLRLESLGRRKRASDPPMARVDGVDGAVVHVDHPDLRGSVHLEGEGTLQVAETPDVVDRALRLLFGLLAPRHDALLIRSCGVICGGVADVFAGGSGAGKSTLASLAGWRPLLSDEHVLVRRQSSVWSASSTPFWDSCTTPGPARLAPLARLWSLRRWPAHEVRVTGAEEALQTVFDNTVLPCPDPNLERAVHEVAAQLASEVPSAELRFRPAADVWEVIEDVRLARW